MVILHRAIVVLLIVGACAACRPQSAPELAMRSYVLAVREHRCDEALNLLSAQTRHATDVLRVHPQHRMDPVPIEQYYCNALLFEGCKWKQMSLSNQKADAATVSMPCGRSQDSFLPGFSSPFLKYDKRSRARGFAA